MAFGGFDTGAGGGFMDGGGSFSQAAPSASTRVEGLLPVCIRQIKTAQKPSEHFQIAGQDVNKIRLVAVVRDVDPKPTRIVYSLEDHTGIINATLWSDSGSDDEAAPMEDSITRHQYAEIFGVIKPGGDDGNNNSITAYKVRPVSEGNAMTHHLIAIVHAQLALAKPRELDTNPLAKILGTTAMSGNTAGNSTSMDIKSDAYGQQHDDGGNDSGLNDVQQKVYNAFHQANLQGSEEGNSVQQVISMTGLPASVVREAVEFLSTEGQIYSTTDDDHFLTTG
eukprot:TRINITY_DN17236_c0_g1_i1.p1 TRINITY_DN17236_c0_g1~~TRINITY_DN17236_c0_g1_i1.p1  ORF type:complete len:299 (+),score=60.47 TRINITY_DN17236_c0_g1_i1:59-898(+)